MSVSLGRQRYRCIVVDLNTQNDFCQPTGTWPVVNAESLVPALRRVVPHGKGDHVRGRDARVVELRHAELEGLGLPPRDGRQEDEPRDHGRCGGSRESHVCPMLPGRPAAAHSGSGGADPLLADDPRG